jgi:carbonic anhydrase/acetyltransferase-like protein (isoleucine patch superfamily)
LKQPILTPIEPHAPIRSAGFLAAILRIAEAVFHAHGFHRDIDQLVSRLMMPARPFVLPFDGTTPRLETEPQYCGVSVSLLGRLNMGRDAWLGTGALVRADGHFSQIGDEFRFGERSTVHIAHELYPAIIGRRVTAGGDVVIHGCTVGDDCVIGDRAIVLDGAVVDSGVVVEPGSTVYPRSMLKAGWVYSGSPAVAVRELEAGELA